MPKPESVNVGDIAHSLARINRFTGHHQYDAYSVAEHAMHVCRRVIDLYPGDPLLHALALHHDDGEFVTGDVSAPMKFAMRTLADEMGFTKSPFDVIEDRVHAVVMKALGLPMATPEQHKIIKAADTGCSRSSAGRSCRTPVGTGGARTRASRRNGRITA